MLRDSWGWGVSAEQLESHISGLSPPLPAGVELVVDCNLIAWRCYVHSIPLGWLPMCLARAALHRALPSMLRSCASLPPEQSWIPRWEAGAGPAQQRRCASCSTCPTPRCAALRLADMACAVLCCAVHVAFCALVCADAVMLCAAHAMVCMLHYVLSIVMNPSAVQPGLLESAGICACCTHL